MFLILTPQIYSFKLSDLQRKSDKCIIIENVNTSLSIKRHQANKINKRVNKQKGLKKASSMGDLVVLQQEARREYIFQKVRKLTVLK